MLKMPILEFVSARQ